MCSSLDVREYRFQWHRVYLHSFDCFVGFAYGADLGWQAIKEGSYGSREPNMKRLITVIILAIVGSLPTMAQDCGGLPCGNIPWQIPQLPELNSPTPFPTVYATATESSEGSVPTATPTLDASGITNQQNNLQSFLSATPQSIVGIDGTPQAIDSSALATDGSLVISYIKAVTLADFGVLSPLLAFLVFILTFTMAVKLIEIFIPFSAVIFRGIRTAFQLVADFLPF